MLSLVRSIACCGCRISGDGVELVAAVCILYNMIYF